MVEISRSSKTSILKTYSRRVNNNAEGPTSKKRPPEEVPIVHELPQVKKSKGSTIQSYFKPLQKSSSSPRPLSQSRSFSSDPLEHSSTPPSSPPSELADPTAHLHKSEKRPRRRLTTRPLLPPLSNTSGKSAEDLEAQDNRHPYTGGCPLGCRPRYYEDDGKGSDDHDCSKSISSEGSTGSTKGHSRRQSTTSGQSNESSQSKISRQPFMTRMIIRTQPKTYVQQQLDVGVPAVVTCAECSMTYNRTDANDRKMHDAHHVRQGTSKIPHGTTKLMETLVDGVQHHILVIDLHDSPARRAYAESVLEIMYDGLPGERISSQELWSPGPLSTPKYKLYIYVIDQKPVSMVIAEPAVVGQPSRCPFFKFSLDAKFCQMAVDRIWTDTSHRRKGYATRLVDEARKTFIPGAPIPKKEVCFSHTTQMGGEFATAYCNDLWDDIKYLLFDPYPPVANVPLKSGVP